MNAANKRKSFAILVGVLLSAGSLGASAKDAPTGPPTFAVDIPAGVACQFPLTLEGWEGRTNSRTFTDNDGNPNFVLTGKGHDFRFTKTGTDRTAFQKSQGVRQEIITYADGSTKYTTSGALLVIMFPTDIPAGPSTTYYNGHTVLHINAEGVATLEPPRGHARDICAELS